jgi:hypothetical protein
MAGPCGCTAALGISPSYPLFNDRRRAATISSVRTRRRIAAGRRFIAIALACLVCGPAFGEEPVYLGMLRARDLSAFGFLRLDMRPAHAVVAPEGTWAFEFELAHQNTWAQSKAVEQYFEALPERRDIGAAQIADIQALPGEKFLVDLELAELDLTIHRKFTSRLGGYLVLSGVNYSGGFLDGTIEKFHDTFGFDAAGRPNAGKNDIAIIADLKNTQIALLDTPVRTGMLDPTIGLRYSAAEKIGGWNFVAEAAAKVAYRGRESFLSTGKHDYGLQVTLQRFSDHHAWYLSAAGVYYDGRTSVLPSEPRVIPTVILGYERHVSDRTHWVLQINASDSVYKDEETDLDELTDPKFQMSLGIYRRYRRGVISFGITENLRNFNNTPDFGLQLGWAYGSALEHAEN